jgi:hypothetical protein
MGSGVIFRGHSLVVVFEAGREVDAAWFRVIP